jgi:hypothetical protein
MLFLGGPDPAHLRRGIAGQKRVLIRFMFGGHKIAFMQKAITQHVVRQPSVILAIPHRDTKPSLNGKE